MAVATQSVTELCRAAKAAARELAALDSATKDRALLAVADALEARAPEILEANARDLEAGRESGLSDALMDRLALDGGRIAGMARGVREIVALPDPVGEVVEGSRFANGLQMRKVRVPLGVVAVVYEARPNVTIDAAALCLKSGNAIVLRGSSSAAHSNAVLAGIARDAVEAHGLPAGALTLVAGGGREELAELGAQEGLIDLMIPRGGEGLKRALQAVAKVPVIYAASGNCHVYVDASADLAMAEAIILNAKTQRPGVCNAAETLLVHADVAAAFLPGALRALAGAGVELRGDERVRALAGDVPVGAATEEDYAQEFLALILAVRVVDSAADAIEHIASYGSGHSEAIVTGDVGAARAFQLGVDAAVRLRERVDALHGRRRVRDGRRDRELDAEAARARADRAARAVRVQVPGRGHGPGPRLALARLGLLGGTFNPPHLGHLLCAQEARLQLGLDRVLLVPAATPPHKEVEAEPGVEHRIAMCELAVAGRRRARRLARGRGPRRAGVHGRAPARAARGGAGGRAHVHRRRRHGGGAPELARAGGDPRAGAARGGRARGRPARRRDRAARRAGGRPGADRVLRHAADRRLQLAAAAARGRGAAAALPHAGSGRRVRRARAALSRPVHGPPILGRQRMNETNITIPQHDISDPAGLARQIADYAADKKAIDIAEIDLRGVLGYTDFFVVCSGNTDRQTKAIHDGIHFGLKQDHGMLPRRVEGLGEARWILMDYLDVIVHVFTPEAREFYRLEQLWGEAPRHSAADGTL